MSRRPLRQWLRKGLAYLLLAIPVYALLIVAIACLISLGYMTTPDFQSDDTPNYEKTI